MGIVLGAVPEDRIDKDDDDGTGEDVKDGGVGGK